MKCDDKLVDTDFNIVIGNVLKEKRLEKGWSLLELSRKRRIMKRKSNKLVMLERNRKSVFYDDLEICMNCGSTYQMSIHEIYAGRNRINSMVYGFVLPLCLKCHRTLQEDKNFNDKWKVKAQKYFEEYIGTREDFIKIFRRNYLE